MYLSFCDGQFLYYCHIFVLRLVVVVLFFFAVGNQDSTGGDNILSTVGACGKMHHRGRGAWF